MVTGRSPALAVSGVLVTRVLPWLRRVAACTPFGLVDCAHLCPAPCSLRYISCLKLATVGIRTPHQLSGSTNPGAGR